MAPTKKRLFIGIRIEETVHNEFLQGPSLYPFLSRVRWTPKQNLHVTLEFLGDVMESGITRLETTLKAVARTVHPFELLFDQICFGPRHREESMLWAQFHINDQWKVLIDKVRKATAFLRDQHLYKTPTPHITLARWKTPGIPQKMNLSGFQIKTQKISVNAVSLYESRLFPEGSQYTILKTFALTKLYSILI